MVLGKDGRMIIRGIGIGISEGVFEGMENFELREDSWDGSE